MLTYPVAHIDLAAVQHNLARVKECAPTSHIMSVIKANAYGHDAVEVAHALSGSDAFAVARLAEGLALREAGFKQAIVILEGVQYEDDLRLASEHTLSLVFHHWSQIELINSVTLNQPLSFCWLMLETGMNRLGLATEKVPEAMTLLTTSQAVSGDIGIMSHFANADEIGHKHNQKQLTKFKQLCEQYPTSPMSIANSAAILSLPESHGDWVRPGLVLYGISPFETQSASELNLKPVMKLMATLTSIQQLEVGDKVGYGGQWCAHAATKVGIVNIGYADGYSRQLSNTGKVLIHGQYANVIGRVSMDMIAVDLAEIKNVSVGDEVTLWGGGELAVETVAGYANTIAYELVSQVNPRVIRKYYHGKN